MVSRLYLNKNIRSTAIPDNSCQGSLLRPQPLFEPGRPKLLQMLSHLRRWQVLENVHE
ncbi:hypothetical protein PHLCEN_2v5982 [Hermanssonia centrifuga]|uniref:Uncharacterized protein n=1 Tax=Hermanssonia centrifuga TaxID=98765 RepID=A0A2R6P0R3_9APHY|nr:hypothetical protein PHLCEN_2v5982 [Hermanssonia centrifuga]